VDELITTIDNLPATIPQLKKYIYIREAKIKAYRIFIDELKRQKDSGGKDIKIKLEELVYEANTLAEEKLYGEAAIGYWSKGLSNKPQGGRPVKNGLSKKTVLKEAGYTKDAANKLEKLDDHIELISLVKINADKKLEICTKQKVLNKIKEDKKKADEEQRQDELNKKEMVDIKNIHLSKFQDKHFDDNSIDHIFTDPPYPAKYLSEWEYLAQEAKRILKPSGFCICYSGTFNLIKVYNILSEYLEYYWQLILLHSGGNQFINARNLNTGYKPILVFQKPPLKKTDTAFIDIIKGSGKEKKDHKWRQAEDEAISILDKLTKTGDTILDPFAGTGTIHIACLKNKRIPISIECEEKNIKVIQERVENILNG